MLSAATRVCRRIGVADPVPVTYRYPGVDPTDERAYQELVIRWLGIQDWEIVEFGADADCLAPLATESLSVTGLVWPVTVHFRATVYARLGAGVLLTGEGGDEVLGLRRSSWVAEAARHIVKGRHVPPARVRREVMRSLAPRAQRGRWLVEEIEEGYSPVWLVDDLRRDLIRRVALLQAEEPLRPSQWASYHLSMPNVWVGTHNVVTFAARFGLRWEAPLLSPEFMGALRGNVRWWEYRGRDILLRHHFADLLPPEILERRTKALFGDAYFGPYTREFARQWDGGGMPVGVDTEWLKDHWTNAESIHAGTAMLLQSAWLAANGGGGEAGIP